MAFLSMVFRIGRKKLSTYHTPLKLLVLYVTLRLIEESFKSVTLVTRKTTLIEDVREDSVMSTNKLSIRILPNLTALADSGSAHEEIEVPENFGEDQRSNRLFFIQSLMRNRSGITFPTIQPSPQTRLSFGEEGKGIKYLNETLSQTPVISPHNFDYIINPANLCTGKDLLFILYVHTAPAHSNRRDTIRKTWGNPKYHGDIFRVLFVFGYDAIYAQPIIDESNKHGDILQESFGEDYKNLTHKGIAALKWIHRYCSHAKFVFKTDDDTFVDSFAYIKYLKAMLNSSYGLSKNTIVCSPWKGNKVGREGKWAVDRRDYNESTFPDYCTGAAFTFTMDVAMAIHSISYHVPFFWVDDSYITGFLVRRIGHVYFNDVMLHFEFNPDNFEEQFASTTFFSKIYQINIKDTKKIEAVWQHLSKRHGIFENKGS